ncbi:MAG: adenosine deaminase [Xenococcus sp. (in: cyanobacteria)]
MRQVFQQESYTSQNEAQTALFFDDIRDRPTRLRAFIQRMPKGGDLHSHLSGAVYAEKYLEWAADNDYCVDKDKKKIIAPDDCSPEYGSARRLVENSSVYNDLIDHWSTRNLPFEGQSGHDQFFGTFGSFGEISSNKNLKDDMIAEVANRAASQNITYLELMLTFKGSEVKKLGKKELDLSDLPKDLKESYLFEKLDKARNSLLNNKDFDELLEEGKNDIKDLDTDLESTLGCSTSEKQLGCDVTINYIQQTTRTKSLEEVFAQLVYAFKLAEENDRVVGINLVAPEDNPTALQDYTKQMKIVGFLHNQHPTVKISLHAGELTLGLVPPKDLRFHIKEAVEIAKANRIGHGVDIFYEEEPRKLLETMREKGVLVEICLTSNEVILNVSGDEHPFPDYWDAGVPVALASDDEGVSRIDLSNEYLKATRTYNLEYLDLKRLARNSLEYSFLQGESLWQSPDFTNLVEACTDDDPRSGNPSPACKNFLNNNPRASEQW